MNECLFCRIVSGAIPAHVVDHSDDAIVIKDLNPQAPVHLLVIPKRHAAHLSEFVAHAPPAEIGGLFALASKAGRDAGSEGYRVVVNEGMHGGQTVAHLHLHVLAGRPMTWPPG